jgi:hypothetical protein
MERFNEIYTSMIDSLQVAFNSATLEQKEQAYQDATANMSQLSEAAARSYIMQTKVE